MPLLAVSFRIAAAVLLALAASAARADDFKLGPISVSQPWTRATTVRTGAAYMTIKLAGNATDRLVKVASPDAERVEMHAMAMDGGVARMREMSAIDLKPGAGAQLKPGGLHLMLVGLRRPLREGESIKLTLTFEQAGTLEVDATVEKAGAPGPRKHKH